MLLLVSCPNSQDSDLVRRYGAAHEVDIGLAVRCTVFLVSPLMSVDRETACWRLRTTRSTDAMRHSALGPHTAWVKIRPQTTNGKCPLFPSAADVLCATSG